MHLRKVGHPNNWLEKHSLYAIQGLTTNLKNWEDSRRWIGIKNTPFFKKAAYLL
jgi:hypothetical protein